MPNPTVARLSSPAELAAGLPIYLGYVPTESLVVACCTGARKRVGLTLRFDLPPLHLAAALVDDVVRRVAANDPSSVLLAVYTEADEDERAVMMIDLVDALEDELDIGVIDAIQVRQGRVSSFLCSDPRCCPPEGVPVAGTAAGVRLIEAERVLQGKVVMPDREALERSLSGPVFLAAERMRQLCEAEAAVVRRAWDGGSGPALRTAREREWRDVLRRFESPPAVLSDEEVARLAMSLDDKLLRDGLAGEHPPEELLPVLRELCTRTPEPYDAPVCTLFAWSTYCDGGGAEVTIAAERALRSDPGYSLALLLLDMLDRQMDPDQVRRLTREALRPVPGATRRGRRSRPSRGSRS